ncbi:MAG: hypothetical protein ACKO0Z_13770 [Betaproteobacteria bacterium]
MAISTALGIGNGIYDPNSQMYANSNGQQMSRFDYERMRYDEEMRYRQMQAMQQTPRLADTPVSNEKQPNPVLLLLKG